MLRKFNFVKTKENPHHHEDSPLHVIAIISLEICILADNFFMKPTGSILISKGSKLPRQIEIICQILLRANQKLITHMDAIILFS